jgi:hypothetical protein
MERLREGVDRIAAFVRQLDAVGRTPAPTRA